MILVVPKRVENKIGRTLNLILNNRPSVLLCFLKIKRKFAGAG